MGFKKAATEQQANYACGKCGEKFIKDKEIYMQKKEDGTWFSCHNLECFKSQGGTVDEKKSFGKFSSSKFPIGDAPQVYAMAELLLDEFKKKRNLIPSVTTSTFDIDGTASTSSTEINLENFTPLTPEQELQAVTSFFNSLSGGFKP